MKRALSLAAAVALGLGTLIVQMPDAAAQQTSGKKTTHGSTHKGGKSHHGGGHSHHGGGHRRHGGKIAAGVAVGVVGAIIVNEAARSQGYGYGGGPSCRSLERRCDDGQGWACRKFDRDC